MMVLVLNAAFILHMSLCGENCGSLRELMEMFCFQNFAHLDILLKCLHLFQIMSAEGQTTSWMGHKSIKGFLSSHPRYHLKSTPSR